VGGGHCGRLVRGIDVPSVVGCVWWYPYKKFGDIHTFPPVHVGPTTPTAQSTRGAHRPGSLELS
jgi:hypothetical protein